MKNHHFLFVLTFFPLFCFSESSGQDSLLNLLKTDPREKHAFIYNELAYLKSLETKFRESNELANKALVLAMEFSNDDEEYMALMNIANNYSSLGRSDSCIYLGKEALKIALEMDNPSRIARVYNHLGVTYARVPEFDKSLSYYLLALKIVEDTLPGMSWEKNRSYESLLLNNIGINYRKMGQTKKALEYYNRSLKIRKEQNISTGIASCLQNIAVIYEKNRNFDTAFMLYREAAQIREELGQISFAAELYMNIGNLYVKTKQLDLAETELKRAIDIFIEYDRKRFLSHAYSLLAGLYLKKKQAEVALFYILKNRELSEEQGYLDNLRDAYGMLAEYYFLKKDYKQVFENKNMEIELNDSIYNSDMSAKIAEMQTKYEMEKKEKEIEILSMNNEIQSLEIKKNTTQIYLLFIAVVIVVLLLLISQLLLNRKRLKQKQTQTELEKSKMLENKLKEENAFQSKQLTTHAINMLQKNKLLQELDADLKTFNNKANSESKNKLNSLRRQINRNMNSEKDWDLFKLYFENVNENFYTTLKDKSNELTSGDLKLAALIKLNLNIKEAAAVLNISPDSLRKARYRLRKKLGLYERENLADYLSRIS